MRKCGLCHHAVSVCVSLSVMFVDCVKTNKHIFIIFSQLGTHANLVCLYQTAWQYSDGNPANGSVECRSSRHNRDSELICGFTAYHEPFQ